MWYNIERLNEPWISSRWQIKGGADVVVALLLIEDDQQAYKYFIDRKKTEWATWHLELLCDILDLHHPSPNRNDLYKTVLKYMLSIRMYDDMEDKVTKFRGDYGFLSMLYECKIPWLDLDFDCLETALIASMTFDRDIQELLATMEVLQAKKLAKVLDVRDDWDDIKIDVARRLSEVKFTNNRNMYSRLMATGNMELIEGNDFYETFWGVCDGEGCNEYGKILMQVRRDLRNHKLIPNWEQ